MIVSLPHYVCDSMKTEDFVSDTVIFDDNTLVISRKLYSKQEAFDRMKHDANRDWLRIEKVYEWHIRYWFDSSEYEDGARFIAWPNEYICNLHYPVWLHP